MRAPDESGGVEQSGRQEGDRKSRAGDRLRVEGLVGMGSRTVAEGWGSLTPHNQPILAEGSNSLTPPKRTPRTHRALRSTNGASLTPPNRGEGGGAVLGESAW